MAGYQPYPEYKDSGVEWLGVVPTSWEPKRLRFALRTNPSSKEIKLSPDALVSFVVMDAVGEYGGLRLDEEKELIDVGSGYTYFANDDVVVAKITPCYENGKGALAEGLTNGVAFGTTELHVLRSGLNLHQPFLFYITISNIFRNLGESEMYGAGGQKRVPESFIKDFVAALPTLQEQQTIARFLDQKTAQIDALIAKKEALLEKLAEKRTALISHAVTKGLNPQAKMKDSGVEWLGQVPEHWGVKRLRFCVFMNPSKNEINLAPDSMASFVPMDAVDEHGGLRLDEEKELSEIGNGYTYFANDDVVVAKITPCFENGKGAIAKDLTNGVAFGTTELHVIRADKELLPEYLFHLTMSHPFRMIGESEMYGAGGQKRIPEDFIKDFRAGIPPLPEQEKIIAYINEKNGHSQEQFNKASEAIEKLKEYRSALITLAVTGKIDVRNVKIPEAPAAGKAA